ncbi:MAG: hypothetical protein IKN12_10615 [Selenomonadaceae bacterium]|nr:hypothetical protein [Selenomonadaceae bacterium]
MPATKFICPTGQEVPIEKCLKSCAMNERCMFLPTLRAVANSLDRGITEATVTELLAGTRETYLKKTTDYAVDPQSVLYALHGQAVHTINENHTEGDILSEIRLNDKITSGKFDLYGKILTNEDGVLGDLKVTSSYKLSKALGIYKVDVPTGEVYKTGAKKGQPKTRKEFRYDGVRHIMDWAIQLNYYRMLLETSGFTVNRMVIQALCRDNNLRTANERGIDRTIYIIPINKISNRWLTRYFSKKAALLQYALKNNKLPPVCNVRERWNNRKCLEFCDAREMCPYSRELRLAMVGLKS